MQRRLTNKVPEAEHRERSGRSPPVTDVAIENQVSSDGKCRTLGRRHRGPCRSGDCARETGFGIEVDPLYLYHPRVAENRIFARGGEGERRRSKLPSARQFRTAKIACQNRGLTLKFH